MHDQSYMTSLSSHYIFEMNTLHIRNYTHWMADVWLNLLSL